VVIITLWCGSYCYAQNSGTGCRINNNVYTEYLGMGYPYVGQTSQPYYNSSGRVLPVNNNNSVGYLCNNINDYGEFSTWDSASQKMVTYPAVRELKSSDGGTCSIAKSTSATQSNGQLVATGGTVITYALTPPAKCGGTTTMPMPLDDYIPYLVAFAGIIGMMLVRKNLIAV